MQPVLIISIITILTLIFAGILRVRRETRSKFSAKYYNELYGLSGDEEPIWDQLSTGNKISAIKLYRQRTGVGLKEAKNAVEAMELEMAEMYQGDDAIRRMLMAGNKITAIKLYRQKTGVGLKEAKEAVEHMMDQGPNGYEQADEIVQSVRGQVDSDELQRLIRAGQKIQAIKYYREATGVGLKEAKEAVEHMMDGVPNAYEQVGETVQPMRGQVDSDELQRLIRAGEKIKAIKYYRESTGVGLKEAKEAVDWLGAQMNQKL